ncbi:hypothetical protein Q4Q39_05440 [Flavivirga amylovorans]|uniref:Serine protease n=1 Tax=Flavivirga amylovorans TaxID=870486 RepID=A0ABT8WYT8_9FLAO|nr:hypothetical protein [Flavivirga amylovorans]MDO5986846.1 hypothetical protein [Flavivirga amylovorans]
MQRFNFSEDLIIAHTIAMNTYKNDPNVFGIDIGNRYENDTRKKELCVRVHLSFDGGYTSTNPLITFINYANFGVQTRRKVITVNSERRKRFQTIKPGISVGTFASGTLGLICFDKLNGKKPCLLTAEHVIEGRVGTIVSQPGAGLDRGRFFADGIANKLRSDTHGDAAIATLKRNRKYTLDQFETSNVINGTQQVKVGDVLTKSGRTTGLTTALVDGVGVYFKKTSYMRRAIKGFRLVPIDDQNTDDIQISDNGDSGAIWFDSKTNKGVGLLFAGENGSVKANQEFCLAQHLPDIIERLNISII